MTNDRRWRAMTNDKAPQAVTSVVVFHAPPGAVICHRNGALEN